MDYKELIFYKKARQVTQGIDVEIRTWPLSTQAQTIARQLFRASASIGANIAEGHGRHTGPEYIHFLLIAQGSANEVDHWLNVALDCHIGLSEKIKQLITLNIETRKMLISTINSLHQKYPSNTVRETSIPYSLIPYKEEDETT